MKILYFTDAHIKGATPSGRSDVFYVAIIRKLMEIGNVIKSDGVDFVVVGGDLFDIPCVSQRLFGIVAKIMRGWGVKIFVVPGNHDIFGQNIVSLEHTSLGSLASTGVVTLVTRDVSPILLGKRTEPNNIVALHGQEYYDGIDTGVNDDYDITGYRAGACNVLVAHGFAVSKAFHPDVPHTIISSITTTADLILTGHYHPDRYDEATALGTKLLKPRSLGRVEATKHNIKYKPDYLILEFNNSKLTHYEFRELQCASDGADIFDATAVANAAKKGYQATLATFTNSVSSADLEQTMSTHDMIRHMAQTVPGVTQEHIINAITLLTQSERGISDKELNGYVPSNVPVNIIEVELTNFQSHKHTIVKLDPVSLNAFIGSSHSGKTAVIRAILWVLYNDPKGTDMISQWATKCEVTVRFDNGKALTRHRTKSSSGGYIVYDEDTQTSVEYNKFSHTIPVEIFNTHQMPKITIGKDKLSLNFAMQLDGPFMLSMSGSERATTIGNVTGADIVDEAIAIGSSKIVNLQREVKRVGDTIEDINVRIKTYDDLPDIKSTVDRATSLVEFVDGLNARCSEITTLQGYLYTNALNINAVEQKLKALPDLDSVKQIISELELLEARHSTVSRLEQECADVNHGITTCEQNIMTCDSKISAGVVIAEAETLANLHVTVSQLHTDYVRTVGAISAIDMSKYNDLDSVQDIIREVESLDSKYDAVSNLMIQYQSVMLTLDGIVIPNVCPDVIEEIESLLIRYDQICDLITPYLDCSYQIDRFSENESKINGTISELVTVYKDKLREMKVCPVCSSVLSEDKIDAIEL